MGVLSHFLLMNALIAFKMEDQPFYGVFLMKEMGMLGFCDGWKRNTYDSGTYYDYLNMNWGWNGTSNGFFLVEDPASFSAGNYLFNSSFTMVSNIHN